MRIALLCMLTLLAACSPSGRNLAASMGEGAGFAVTRFDTPFFVLYGQLRPGQGPVLYVYIEGDGFSWATRSRPSSDPTPKNPVGLRLAMADPSQAPVLYLARPCQYVENADRRMCTVNFWTSGRFAPEVIDSLNNAVSQAMERTGAQQVALLGYSGGGGVAALLAARRSDVAFLGTVAGNVDHQAWTAHHSISPMRHSLNPLDVASQLRHLPQRHLSSSADSIVPPLVSAGFCRKAERVQSCVVIDGMEHNGHWEDVWDYNYTE